MEVQEAGIGRVGRLQTAGERLNDDDAAGGGRRRCGRRGGETARAKWRWHVMADGLGSARLGWLAGGGLALRWAGRGEMMMPTRRRGVDSAREAKLHPSGNFGGFCCSCLVVDPRLRLPSTFVNRHILLPSCDQPISPLLLSPSLVSYRSTYKKRERKF
jgi:hypothetical protein